MSNIIKVDNPSSSQIKFSPEENQMFGILIVGINPSEDTRLFTIESFINEYNFET